MKVPSLLSVVDTAQVRVGSLVVPAHGGGFDVIEPSSSFFSTASFLTVGVVEPDGSIRRTSIDEDEGDD